MNKTFLKEMIWTNYLVIGGFAAMLVAANLYYGSSPETWLRTMPIALILIPALIIKLWRIKKRSKDLDERIEYITRRALSVGFYFLLAVILWYYTKEMALYGEISTRTYVELFAGLIGYVGSLFIFRRIY
ncbi:MAG: hypothetical protein AB1815_00750 [Bacillota bacterium]|jgi:hypothetical protein